MAQTLDHWQSEIGTLELRIGVENDRPALRCLGYSREIGFDALVADREISFENRQYAVGSGLDHIFRLSNRIAYRRRRHAGDNGHPAAIGPDYRVDDVPPLLLGEIGKFTGAAERRQSVDPRVDQVIHQILEHAFHDGTRLIDRGNEIGKNTAEGHDGSPLSGSVRLHIVGKRVGIRPAFIGKAVLESPGVGEVKDRDDTEVRHGDLSRLLQERLALGIVERTAGFAQRLVELLIGVAATIALPCFLAIGLQDRAEHTGGFAGFDSGAPMMRLNSRLEARVK